MRECCSELEIAWTNIAVLFLWQYPKRPLVSLPHRGHCYGHYCQWTEAKKVSSSTSFQDIVIVVVIVIVNGLELKPLFQDIAAEKPLWGFFGAHHSKHRSSYCSSENIFWQCTSVHICKSFTTLGIWSNNLMQALRMMMMVNGCMLWGNTSVLFFLQLFSPRRRLEWY